MSFRCINTSRISLLCDERAAGRASLRRRGPSREESPHEKDGPRRLTGQLVAAAAAAASFLFIGVNSARSRSND